MDRFGVSKAVLICANVHLNPDVNDYVAECVARYPDRLIQFADVDSMWTPTYHAPGAAERLRAAAERYALKGFTHYVKEDTDWFASDEGLRFFDVAQEYGLIASLALPPTWQPALRELARHPKVVALGETGLDYYRLPSKKAGFTAADDERYKARQAALFQQHLEVAAETGLGCVIHQRESLEDILAQLAPCASRVRGVFHCFSDSVAAMQRILALGSLVSFTGILTFKNAQNIRDTLAATPLDRFMLETDSPFLAPVPYRGKRCEPAYVREIAEVAAQIKGCSLETLSGATCATAERFFSKLPPR
jgi:TatD DNase family protein